MAASPGGKNSNETRIGVCAVRFALLMESSAKAIAVSPLSASSLTPRSHYLCLAAPPPRAPRRRPGRAPRPPQSGLAVRKRVPHRRAVGVAWQADAPRPFRGSSQRLVSLEQPQPPTGCERPPPAGEHPGEGAVGYGEVIEKHRIKRLSGADHISLAQPFGARGQQHATVESTPLCEGTRALRGPARVRDSRARVGDRGRTLEQLQVLDAYHEGRDQPRCDVLPRNKAPERPADA